MKLSFIVFLGFFLYSATMDGIHLHKKQTSKQTNKKQQENPNNSSVRFTNKAECPPINSSWGKGKRRS